jgi:hypothetical protein
MKTFYRIIAVVCIGLAVSAVPAHAQTSSSHPSSSINWQQHDTAVYVVSTLNLLGRSHGGNIQQVLQRLNVSHIDVYADTVQSNLYFIELKRDSGALVGSLAYEMGWAKPRRVTWSAGKGVPTVDPAIVQDYRVDAKALIGSFTSTLPQ